jgi:hypothetical protein
MTARKSFICILALVFVCVLTGCAHWPRGGDSSDSSDSSKKRAEPYGYQPIDPLPVVLECTGTITSANLSNSVILKSLPDETMRLAMTELTGGTSITYGPGKIGYAGKDYMVVLDWIKFDTKKFNVGEESKLSTEDGKSVLYRWLRPLETTETPKYIVPAYVGIGVRLTARFRVQEGSVDLGNLFLIGASAQAKQVKGTLTIQTMGISGPTISPNIPVPSDLDVTAIQNAVMALAAIRAKVYGNDHDLTIVPRVVAFYNTLGADAKDVKQFISNFLDKPVPHNVGTTGTCSE